MPAVSRKVSKPASDSGVFSPGSSKSRLLRTAEKAFAEHGIDGVSLRQISERSGSRNVMAAQYHFGNKDSLIAEIIDNNTKSLDRIRQRLYREANLDFDQMGTFEYVRMVIQPFLEIKNDQGQRTFVRFLRALLHHDPYYRIWKEHYAKAPFTDNVYGGLRQSLPPMPDAIWEMRKAMVGKLVVNSTSDYDFQSDHPLMDEATFMADLIEVVTAILRAPAGKPGNLTDPAG